MVFAIEPGRYSIAASLMDKDIETAGGKPYSSYYGTEGLELILGDSIPFMSDLKPSSIDLIFADPPYRLSKGGTTCHAGKRVSVDKGDWDKSSGVHEDHAFNKLWLDRAERLLKDSGTIFVTGTYHILFSIGYAMQELGFRILNVITWYKPNAAPNLSCRYFTHSTEFVIWAAPRRTKPLRHTFNYELMKKIAGGKQMRDVWLDAWEIPTTPAREKVFGKHPTQKPVELITRCILAASNEGDIVLDPFCGSGTSGVAAVDINRKYIGVDTEEEYLAMARERIKDKSKEVE